MLPSWSRQKHVVGPALHSAVSKSVTQQCTEQRCTKAAVSCQGAATVVEEMAGKIGMLQTTGNEYTAPVLDQGQGSLCW